MFKVGLLNVCLSKVIFIFVCSILHVSKDQSSTFDWEVKHSSCVLDGIYPEDK